MTTQAKLFFFCGKMAAGKSTLANALADRQDTVLLVQDDLLENLYPGEIVDIPGFVKHSASVARKERRVFRERSLPSTTLLVNTNVLPMTWAVMVLDRSPMQPRNALRSFRATRALKWYASRSFFTFTKQITLPNKQYLTLHRGSALIFQLSRNATSLSLLRLHCITSPTAHRRFNMAEEMPDFSDVNSGVESTAVKIYEVKAGDSLSKIAKAEYGNANAYMLIFEANKDILKDPNMIHPGQKLKIPPK